MQYILVSGFRSTGTGRHSQSPDTFSWLNAFLEYLEPMERIWWLHVVSPALGGELTALPKRLSWI